MSGRSRRATFSPSDLPPRDPRGYFHPESEEEICALVRYARARGLAVRVTGSAHSEPGAIVTDAMRGGASGGAVDLVLDRYTRITFDDAKKEVEVEAGCRLARDPRDPLGSSHDETGLCFALDQRGWALPSMGGVSHQTVAGFLATGSSGGSLDRSMARQVVRMRVIDGRGEVHELSRERDPEAFGAAGVSLGLLGIVSTITLRCVERFDLIGRDTVRPIDRCGVELFARGPEDLPSFFDQQPYARMLWWPQPGIDKIAIWTARPMKEADYGPETGEPGRLFRRPYRPLPPILGSSIPTQIAAASALVALDRWPALLEARAPGLRPTLQNLFVGEGTEGPQRFWDTWWQGLPMDNEMDERLLPVRFLEMWLDLEDSAEVMDRLRRCYRREGLAATANFVVEVYPGCPSPFFLSPGYERPSVRLNFFWFQGNREDPMRRFFPRFLELFADLDFRLHWGKALFPDPARGAAYLRPRYPRWDDFMKVRETFDPEQRFVTRYWREHLAIPEPPRPRPARSLEATKPEATTSREAPTPGTSPPTEPSYHPRLRWPLLFRMKPSALRFAHRAQFVFDQEAVIEASPRRVFEVMAGTVGGREWIPLFLGAEWRMGARVGRGVCFDQHFAFMRLRLRTLVSDPGRRWAASVDAASLPLGTEMLEIADYEPLPGGHTRVRWRIYYTPPASVRPLHPILRPLFSRFFRSALANLGRYLRAHPGRDDQPARVASAAPSRRASRKKSAA